MSDMRLLHRAYRRDHAKVFELASELAFYRPRQDGDKPSQSVGKKKLAALLADGDPEAAAQFAQEVLLFQVHA